MPVTVSTELYIQATPADVAGSLASASGNGRTLTLEGGWHLVAWSPSLDSWRHDVSWGRGRVRASGTVDLLAADAGRTLVVVSLTTRAWSLRRTLSVEAATLARRLRTAAERGHALPLVTRTGVATPDVRLALPTAVGYSGP